LPDSGGLTTFGDLVAPNTTLILASGAGRAVGTLDVGGLVVLGNGGGTDLNGVVNGLGGDAAAHLSTIEPLQNANYRLNSCPLHSINCVLLSVQAPPVNSPLTNLSIVGVPDQQDDPDLLLPNISDKDY
jgi:hypothetical protein